MKRRQFLLGTAALGLSGLLAGFAAVPRADRARLDDLAALEKFLDGLQSTPLQALQGWSPAKVFHHCAQSIEYSLDGFPQLKPAWFRQSVGPLAFSVFASRGGMRHPLDEPIPGAPELSEEADLAEAIARLRQAFTRFINHSGPLQPHFAYGALSHQEYLQAHLMHLAEHMSLIRSA